MRQPLKSLFTISVSPFTRGCQQVAQTTQTNGHRLGYARAFF
jgi:hypothetical protein